MALTKLTSTLLACCGTVMLIAGEVFPKKFPSPLYCATKFALEGFTESLSYELASQNIVVKMVEPGGGDTAFHARSSKLNTGDGGLDSYGPFLERANAALGKLAKGMATPESISAVIYGAVTDGTKRLRYFAGDDVKHLVEARRKLSDEDYENYMRAQFA